MFAEVHAVRGRRWLYAVLLACTLAAQAAPAPDPAALAARIHQEVNAARAQQGLPPLSWQAALADIARGHSRDMAAQDYFAHTSPAGKSMRDRYTQAGYECAQRVGSEIHLGAENIAMHTLYRQVVIGSNGQRDYEWLDDAALARKVVAGWMESAGHRRNILSPTWQHEGIGLAFNAAFEVLITQNFC